tara:strand:- start:80 stop:262 length:183 start_codon:yes stop_codon:yes gene_type:complete
MVSRCKDYQEDTKLRVMQLINQNSQNTARKLAQTVGISNGAANYLFKSLVVKGFVKLFII